MEVAMERRECRKKVIYDEEIEGRRKGRVIWRLTFNSRIVER